MRRSSVVAAVLLFGGLAVAVGGLAMYKVRQIEASQSVEAYEPAETVELVDAQEKPWQPMADLVGTVIAVRSVVVRNEIAGVVRSVGFDSGSVVEEGQVLLTLDDTADRADLEAAKAAVRVAEATVPQAEARIRLAERMLERLSSAETRAVAASEIDRARSELDAARADRDRWLAEVDQARARVAQVETRIAKLTIRAPFRARAGMRSVHEGQYLAEGTDVVALQELTDKIYLDFAIPQEYAARVKPGTAVMATGALLGPEPVRIEVVAVDATVNNDTRNLRVRAVVDNTRGLLVPGMFIQIRVPTQEPRPYVVVPSTAVRRAAYADSVFVVEPAEAPDTLRSKQRFVKLGPSIGDEVVVLEGLKPGERVAASGSFKLRDGALVAPAPPGAPGPNGQGHPAQASAGSH